MKYGTAIVLLHLLINVVHGAAHARLHIDLDSFDRFFVLSIILILPLIAMVLLWTSRKTFGLGLLTCSMLASLLFGAYHHFWVAGPDNVRSQTSEGWGLTFIVTGYGLLLTEAIGTWLGIYLLRSRRRASR